MKSLASLVVVGACAASLAAGCKASEEPSAAVGQIEVRSVKAFSVALHWTRVHSSTSDASISVDESGILKVMGLDGNGEAGAIYEPLTGTIFPALAIPDRGRIVGDTVSVFWGPASGEYWNDWFSGMRAADGSISGSVGTFQPSPSSPDYSGTFVATPTPMSPSILAWLLPSLLRGMGDTLSTRAILLDPSAAPVGHRFVWSFDPARIRAIGPTKFVALDSGETILHGTLDNGMTVELSARITYSVFAILPESPVLIVGQSKALTVQRGHVLPNGTTGFFSYRGATDWRSSNRAVATVSQAGWVTAVGVGETTITVVNELGKTLSTVVRVQAGAP